MEEEKDFWVECNVCKTQYKNWTGSTQCCGSLAFIIEDGEPTNKATIYTKEEDGSIKPDVIEF